jgi:polyphosphate kinase 2 (PPK2 family)
VLLFEGWDAAGKGGVIRRITAAMDPELYHVVPIAAPTEEECARHYLWRFWRYLPRAGRVLIFDRSWYGRVLVERVEGLTPALAWQRAYSEINDFEQQLYHHGMIVLKFWLHIDPDEQMKRFQTRQETPYKKYKLTEEDYRNREKWRDYERAVHDMVERTSTIYAPWHLVASNDKRWARICVLRTYCRALKQRLALSPRTSGSRPSNQMRIGKSSHRPVATYPV